MKNRLLIILAFVSLMCVSCSDEPNNESAMPPLLVVEGGIDSDGYVRVLLTSSIVPDTEGGTLDDIVIRWGKVTVNDGSRTVVLTGGPDNKYMPPYTYYSYEMIGRPGATYTLTAEYGGRKVTAESTMCPPAPITHIECAPSGTPGLYSLTINFTAPDDAPAYYHVCSQLIGEDEHPYPAIMGTVKATHAGEELSVPVYRGKHFGNSKDFSPLWPDGAEVMVVLERVDSSVYDFWMAYNDNVLFGGSQFVSSATNLPSNVNGGFGVWSARGVSSRTIIVGK